MIHYLNIELHTLLVTHRHGDRAAIHTIPGDVTNTKTTRVSSSSSSSTPTNSESSSISLYHPNALLSLTKSNNLQSFSILPLSSSGDIARGIITDNTQQPLTHFMHAISAKTMFQVSDIDLPQGQLTSTGYMQLTWLVHHYIVSNTR